MYGQIVDDGVEPDATDSLDDTTYPIKKNDLKTWNISIGVLHGLSFVAVLVLSIIYNAKVPLSNLTTDFWKFDTILNIFVSDFRVIASYNALWVLLPFPLITSFFHVMLGTFMYVYYSFNVLRKGIQMFRWIEYSITAGLMTWVIVSLSGVTNIFLQICLLMLNINMNIFGLVSEILNATNVDDEQIPIDIRGKEEKELTLKSWYKKIYFKEFNPRDRVVWWPIWIAFLTFFVIWTVALTYFFEAIASRSDNVPWFVWTINIGLFFQYLGFGLIMVGHYSSKQMVIEQIKKNENITFGAFKRQYYFATILANRYYNELFYQVLSLTSKLFLTYFLLGGIIR